MPTRHSERNLKGLARPHLPDLERRVEIALESSKGSQARRQKDRRYPTGCRESYVAADALEAEIEDLYQRVEVPVSWANGLEEMLAAEITGRNATNLSEREALTRRRERTEGERRKLLDAYYANAIDVATLRTEQERIAGGMGTIDARLAALDASLEDWQDLISTSLRFATNCARIYRRAGDSRRKEFNTAVLEEVLVRDGHVVNAAYQAPFDLLFAMPKFEYEDVVEVTSHTAGAWRLSRDKGRACRACIMQPPGCWPALSRHAPTRRRQSSEKS